MSRFDDDGSDGRPDVEVGGGYPQFQLAKALQRLSVTGDPKAADKAKRWLNVLEGMYSGQLSIGSRTPIAGTPPWVTLEVVTGGFATGNYLAGGKLQDHEIVLAKELGININSDTRAVLNSYYLSEGGQDRLNEYLSSGNYQITVPEEAALLIVCWLLKNRAVNKVNKILDEIAPYFDQLRFYPAPGIRPTVRGEEVYLQSVSESVKSLEKVKTNQNISSQKEAIEIWIPLYERAVGLLLDSVDGSVPTIELDNNRKPVRTSSGKYNISGGYPFKKFSSEWYDRATRLLDEHTTAVGQQTLRKGRYKSGTTYARILDAVQYCVKNRNNEPVHLTEYCRIALARHIAKHGVPSSDSYRAHRELQLQQISSPLYADISKILVARLRELPQNDGLRENALSRLSVSASESNDKVSEGTIVPYNLSKKVARSQVATVSELVLNGLISSADVIAMVMPQITAKVKTSNISDPELKRVYTDLYCAFRNRRSLLLLNLESQVKFEELPWAMAVKSYRTAKTSQKDDAKKVLHDVIALSVTHFPHAIIPNKLLQELYALVKESGLNIPIVDEVAADIFMGHFSAKFAKAAQISSVYLQGTLYSKYYDINLTLNTKKSFFKKSSPSSFDESIFSNLCNERAGSKAKNQWSVASNGIIIEQQQILTTQNIAPLFEALDLRSTLKHNLGENSKQCFRWICRRLQTKSTNYHAKLIAVKNSAYAWRQMIFYLSVMDDDECGDVIDWINSHYYKQSQDFVKIFSGVMKYFNLVVSGQQPTDKDGQFLGWSVGAHPLIASKR